MIEGYELQGPIGRGSQSVVLRAVHLATKQPVALKLVQRNGDHATTQRFRREVEILNWTDHPGILKMHDHGKTSTHLYHVCELAPTNVRQVMNRYRPLQPLVAAQIAVQIAAALDFLQVEDIVHRDLKPDNLLISFDRKVKLCDFGIARRVNETDVTMHGELLGTFVYMSPEAFIGGPPDPRSDLYSLGAVLYELLAGARAIPDEAKTRTQVLHAIIHGNLVKLRTRRPDVPAGLEALVHRLLDVDPAQRPTAAMVRNWLQEFIDDCNPSREISRMLRSGILETPIPTPT